MDAMSIDRPGRETRFETNHHRYYIPTTTTETQQAQAANNADRLLHRNNDGDENQKSNNKKRDLEAGISSDESVLYLAYGSNLATDVFLGKRDIKPLSQINVLVPDLRLTFDIPGLPYSEPCFAGARSRHASDADENENENEKGEEEEHSNTENLITGEVEKASERSRLLDSHGYHRRYEYHKDRWLKPLVGVVYEVTKSDYARIIATEGGGLTYADVVVTCYPFADDYDLVAPVPDYPTTKPFQAHTLLSPVSVAAAVAVAAEDEDGDHHFSFEQSLPVSNNPCSLVHLPSRMRPDPSYAQPSLRYLNLITAGAAEHNLPLSYRNYLSGIRPYRTSSLGQRVGRAVYLIFWGPWLVLFMALTVVLAGPDGRSPSWLVAAADVVRRSIWDSYDKVFRRLCGDGERTVYDR